jgi:hypothetical protein
MLQATFDRLPTEVQQFIKQTTIPLEHTDVLYHPIRVTFTNPYTFSKKKSKTYERLTGYNAESARLWWVKG